MSTITVSKPLLRASVIAPLARRTGSRSPAGSCTRTPASLPTTFNCSMAAGRRTSVDTMMGWRPCFVSQSPSFPAVVVFPDPWRPSRRMTRGMRLRRRQPPAVSPKSASISSRTMRTTCCGRRQALQNLLIDRAIAYPVDEGLDDLEIDVGLEQRHPDLAERRLDGRFRQPDFAAERAKYSLEAVAERFKHVVNDRRWRGSLPSGAVAAARHRF